MTWQQWLIALWLVMVLAFGVWRATSNRQLKPTIVTLSIMMAIAEVISVVFVLHSGGFW